MLTWQTKEARYCAGVTSATKFLLDNGHNLPDIYGNFGSRRLFLTMNAKRVALSFEIVTSPIEQTRQRMRRISIKSLAVLILLSFCAHLGEISLLTFDNFLDHQQSNSAPQTNDHAKTSATDAESGPGLELALGHHGLGCQLSHNFSTPGAVKWLGPNRIALESPSFPAEAEFSLPTDLPWSSQHFHDIFHPPA